MRELAPNVSGYCTSAPRLFVERKLFVAADDDSSRALCASLDDFDVFAMAGSRRKKIFARPQADGHIVIASAQAVAFRRGAKRSRCRDR